MDSQTKHEFLKNLDILFSENSISHFDPQETVELDNPQWEFDSVYPPPKRLHKNIIPTIKIADEVRERWGGSIMVVSGFRPFAYNDIVGGSPRSQHIFYRALDLKPLQRKTKDYSKFISFVSKIVSERRERGQIIGFGKYDTFVHIDTGRYNHNRDWNKRT